MEVTNKLSQKEFKFAQFLFLNNFVSKRWAFLFLILKGLFWVNFNVFHLLFLIKTFFIDYMIFGLDFYWLGTSLNHYHIVMIRLRFFHILHFVNRSSGNNPFNFLAMVVKQKSNHDHFSLRWWIKTQFEVGNHRCWTYLLWGTTPTISTSQ